MIAGLYRVAFLFIVEVLYCARKKTNLIDWRNKASLGHALLLLSHVPWSHSLALGSEKLGEWSLGSGAWGVELGEWSLGCDSVLP